MANLHGGLAPEPSAFPTATTNRNFLIGIQSSRKTVLELDVSSRIRYPSQGPSMLLGPSLSSTALLPMAYRTAEGLHGSGLSTSDDSSRNRRVLGFDITSLDATSSSSETAAFGESYMASSLGITWDSPVSGLGAQLRRLTNGPCKEMDGLTLTRSEIDSLRVVELKQACSERGLPTGGNKAELRDRLWNWTVDEKESSQVKITGDFLTRYYEDMAENHHDENVAEAETEDTASDEGSSTPNSLAEWARTIDIEPLLQKRKEIIRQKREGRPSPKKQQPRIDPSKESTADYLKSLARALRAPSSPYASNIKVKELYAASKQADQLGERKVAIDLLQTLLMVTPSDARVYRRLARMYSEQGDVDKAKDTLRAGLDQQPENPWLWHGLGQIERNHGTYKKAKECFAKAIEHDPTYAHAYHALGTMEHGQGNIASAMRIIKKGLEFSPTNHRLWHAYGDVYRAAQMLDDAERSYRRALKHGPHTSYGFAFSALAAVSYEFGDVDKARSWLSKAVEMNDGRHAHGWVALAQLEEAEGNVQKARVLSTSAISQYERGLLEARQRYLKSSGQRADPLPPPGLNATNSIEMTTRLLKQVPKYRSGDKFIYVYQNWARLEERYGDAATVDRVYERAKVAFPYDYKILLSWALYHTDNLNFEKARSIYQEACSKAGKRHADPYRMAAELEISLSNYHEARRILYLGTQSLIQTDYANSTDRKGLPRLLQTWAVCEWHLGNLDRAEVLFGHALRLAPAESRTNILYTIARFKHYQGELHVAQHCIGLVMKDSIYGGDEKEWSLWAEIARDMGNVKLEEECLEKASLARATSPEQDDLSRFLKAARSRDDINGGIAPSMEKLVRKDPWQTKLFGSQGKASDSNAGYNLKFPSRKDESSREARQLE
eukprot:CAMPEP_0176008464 /NCGR_PEP_ID=MMETSP0120_2-20121206/3758_1 /TAXON_ID=160619 /ORGANISM="Kryptoperidinium foliaceum, Strain CCMP 1326" /LENGTH=893 /DNA_ID=CAMNT_0017341249 /DNA_START=306 /DNA_END=2987 /DNA_ORIENTATION=-